jgi:predicted nucleotide-binding protein (sugar kinase/HSP70/actin superfamily)
MLDICRKALLNISRKTKYGDREKSKEAIVQAAKKLYKKQ